MSGIETDGAQASWQSLEAAALRRALSETGRGDAGQATRDGQQMISFCCNDYLGLSQHPQVKQAALAAIEQYGAGAGASRLVTGNHPLYEDLENAPGTAKRNRSGAGVWQRLSG